MDVVTRRLSPCNSSCRFLPSNDTQDVFRLSIDTDIFNSTPAGTTIGRKLNECGQIGVTMMAGTDGCIIDAPAATAYAVLPVGVDTIKPSPWTDVMCLPSRNRSILQRYGDGPRSMTTSFSTCRRKWIRKMGEKSLDNSNSRQIGTAALLTKMFALGFSCFPLLLLLSLVIVFCASRCLSQVSWFFLTIMQRNRLRRVRAACPSSTLVTCSWKLSN